MNSINLNQIHNLLESQINQLTEQITQGTYTLNNLIADKTIVENQLRVMEDNGNYISYLEHKYVYQDNIVPTYEEYDRQIMEG